MGAVGRPFAGVIGVVLALGGCTPQVGADSAREPGERADRASGANPRDLVLVSREYSGGRQCDGVEAVPPDAEKILREHGVVVFQSSCEDLPVCEACGICPDYAFLHRAGVRRRDLGVAEGLGYTEERNAPSPLR